MSYIGIDLEACTEDKYELSVHDQFFFSPLTDGQEKVKVHNLLVMKDEYIPTEYIQLSLTCYQLQHMTSWSYWVNLFLIITLW